MRGASGSRSHLHRHATEHGRDAARLAVARDDLLIGATPAARKRLRLTDECLNGNRTAAELLDGGAAASFRDSERAVLRQALAAAGGNATRAARALGIGRATLYRRMDKAGLARH